jgi:Arc/MetJ-type ribon-helix-helix transcriptional regulator
MRIITVHLPDEFISGLDELVRLDRYPNRSEAIRYSVRDLLKDELWSTGRVFIGSELDVAE